MCSFLVTSNRESVIGLQIGSQMFGQKRFAQYVSKKAERRPHSEQYFKGC